MKKLATILFLLTCASCGDGPTIIAETLQVISWVPNRGAQCVAGTSVDFMATVTFSDDVVPSTLSAESLFVRPDGGDAVSGAIVYDTEAQTASLSLLEDLSFGEIHELVVTDSVRGEARGRLAAELVSRFETIGPGGCY